MKNYWFCEDEKVLVNSPIMDVIEQRCRSSEDERRLNFFLLRARNWSNIIPITETGNVVMVKQYRVGIAQYTLEVPGGVIDPQDPNSEIAALRELQEETGYCPSPGSKCLHLGWTFPNPAILNNQCHSYVIGPVRKINDQKLDPGEMIEVIEVPISDIPEKILAGEINHALMLNTFFFLALCSKSTSTALINELSQFIRPQLLEKD